MHQRLVHARVERVALAAPKRVRPSLVDRSVESFGDLLEAAVELAVLAGPVDVVEHRQQRGQRVS